MFMTSETAIVASLDSELAAFLADYDVYAGLDGIDADAPLALPDDGASPLAGPDAALDAVIDGAAVDFVALDPGSIDPDAPPADPVTSVDLSALTVVDPMLADDGATFDPAAADPAPGGDTAAPAAAEAVLPAFTDPGADPAPDTAPTFVDVDLGAEFGILLVGRAFDFTDLP